jgi:meromycolic acid enoyl-[acyl-carrier protein] reductase
MLSLPLVVLATSSCQYGSPVLLAGKRLLVTGVLTEDSIAFAVAQRALAEGAEVVLTGFGRGLRITQRIAGRLHGAPPVLELDVNVPAHIEAVAEDLEQRWGRLDGLLHAVAFAPEDALGGRFLTTPVESAELAFRTSAFSLKALAAGMLPLLERAEGGASLVGLDFDATVAWPVYDWMGVAKAALESVTRYLARDLGPRGGRANLVSAGPLRTMAARSIPGFSQLAEAWERGAPLGWDTGDPVPVADACVFLLSDLSRAITGEILHVDGGYHAMGAPIAPASGEPQAGLE